MKALIAIAAVAVVIASAAVTVNAVGTNSADARPMPTQRYYEPLPQIAESLKQIAKTDKTTLKEVQMLNKEVGTASLYSLAEEVHAIKTVLGDGFNISTILGELKSLNGKP
jgi:hypothetical protein